MRKRIALITLVMSVFSAVATNSAQQFDLNDTEEHALFRAVSQEVNSEIISPYTSDASCGLPIKVDNKYALYNAIILDVKAHYFVKMLGNLSQHFEEIINDKIQEVQELTDIQFTSIKAGIIQAKKPDDINKAFSTLGDNFANFRKAFILVNKIDTKKHNIDSLQSFVLQQFCNTCVNAKNEYTDVWFSGGKGGLKIDIPVSIDTLLYSLPQPNIESLLCIHNIYRDVETKVVLSFPVLIELRNAVRDIEDKIDLSILCNIQAREICYLLACLKGCKGNRNWNILAELITSFKQNLKLLKKRHGGQSKVYINFVNNGDEFKAIEEVVDQGGFDDALDKVLYPSTRKKETGIENVKKGTRYMMISLDKSN